MKNPRKIDRKLNALIKEILEEEDQENNMNAKQCEICPEDCEKSDNTIKEAPKQCRCAIENSSRFSLRVIEAIRALQHSMKPSTVKEIVGYIRTNYCHDGDLYSQVRTALKQVCFQRFVIKLLNEYHLISPISISIKQSGSRLHHTARSTAIDKILRKRKNINNRCLCKPISKLPHQSSQSKYQNPKLSHKKSLKRTIIDRIKNRKYSHSTRILANEMDKANYNNRKINFEKLSSFCNAQNNCRQHDATKAHEMEQKGECLNPILGSSKKIVKTSISSNNARKKAREDRAMKYANENDEKIMMEKDCICDTCAVQIERDANLRKQLPDHARVVNKNQRNVWCYENEENEEEKEDEKDKKKKEEEEEEDANTEDSAYRQLRKRNPCRTRTRERELKRWIQRCRKECERHNTRKK